MAFFQRVFSYVFNEVLVNTLANSKSFQRFAVRTTHMVEEMTKKGADTQGQLGEKAAEFKKIFRDEMKKGMDSQFRNNGKQPPKQ
ncbi:hypothetical protein ABBQ38_002244 [Trebouxia sp. C0009 RCD-2024]